MSKHKSEDYKLHPINKMFYILFMVRTRKLT